jgi:hypothetical protein
MLSRRDHAGSKHAPTGAHDVTSRSTQSASVEHTHQQDPEFGSHHAPAGHSCDVAHAMPQR